MTNWPFGGHKRLSPEPSGPGLCCELKENMYNIYRTEMEKEMAIHFRIHAWITLWTEEPGGLQSMGSQRIRHN